MSQKLSHIGMRQHALVITLISAMTEQKKVMYTTDYHPWEVIGYLALSNLLMATDLFNKRSSDRNTVVE